MSSIYVSYMQFSDGDGNICVHPYSHKYYTNKDEAIEDLKVSTLKKHEKYSNISLIECPTFIESDMGNIQAVYAFYINYTVTDEVTNDNWELSSIRYFIREYHVNY